jgi:demethylmenaquinone methyltransferase/2-methoxy-6-polyprenyl-1,4-benzoquinol methylase
MQINKNSVTIKQMFNSIAKHYDTLNHILSLNQDKRWRKKAVSYLSKYNLQNILDIATGTGDMVVELIKQTNANIYAIDIAENMLEIAKNKVLKYNNKNAKVFFYQMSAENLFFDNEIFDAVTIAFGIRNFENIEKALNQINRVLIDKGKLVVIEFIEPSNKIKRFLLNIYLKTFIPIVGKIVSKNKFAYSYLPQSIETFYKENEFINLCIKNNFKLIRKENFNLGLVCIFVFEK